MDFESEISEHTLINLEKLKTNEVICPKCKFIFKYVGKKIICPKCKFIFKP
ncbi:hypothetical protein [Methanococcus vannielii]|uniref:hypothetical protein n=1 Tax=Methanococcus vannielii TaxID=2187 RepID=UPI00032350D3|nr:hypothetical protein [Methanococcus vannielii]